MNALKLLLNEENSKKICFLCFEESTNIISIDERMEIFDENSEVSTTLRETANYLFPFYDILADQACVLCSEQIIEMYTSIKRGLAKIKLIKKLTEKIQQETESKTALANEISKKSTDFTKYDIKIKTESNKNPELCIKRSENDYVCDVCRKSYKYSTHLKTHLKSHEKTLCPLCQENIELSCFKSHLRSHSKSVKRNAITNFKCDNCDYKTVNNLDLKSHINKMHLKVRPYICHVCQKGFFSSKNFKEHISIHKKDKIMICDVCGERYSYRKTLEFHMRSHLNHRPYDCDQCGHKFVSISQRNEHIKRKHSPKQFECSLCDKKYSLKKELTRHSKIIHNVTSRSKESINKGVV